jgi:hypothetical protein
MSRNVLFISRNDIIKRSYVGGNIDPEKIIPFVKTAQDKNILTALGTVLYKKLQDDVEAKTITGVYKELIDLYIVDTLVHYSVCEALPFLAYTIANGSIYKNVSEQAINPSKNDIDFLLQKELQTAQFYMERLVTYLIANNQIYPEYNQTNGQLDNVYPDKGQAYTNGWVL